MVTAAIGTLVFLAFAGGLSWLILGITWGSANAAEKRVKDFPQVPYGFTTPRMKDCPYGMDVAGAVLTRLVNECAATYGVTRTRVRECLRYTNVTWVAAIPGEDHIIDDWGRAVHGLFDGKDCTVVYWQGAQLRDTAFAYELLRAIKKGLRHGDWMASNQGEDIWPEGDWELLARVRIGSGQ